MSRPFRQTNRVALDAPVLVIEILSPDDRMKATLERFRQYEKLDVAYPPDGSRGQGDAGLRAWQPGAKDVEELGLDQNRRLPFDTRKLLSRVDEE